MKDEESTGITTASNRTAINNGLDSNGRMEQVARDTFGIELRPYQRLVISDILETASGKTPEKCVGRVVLLPTGGGKSFCFMVPAMMLPGPTLVIYPLLALLADQERRVKDAKIDCAILRGGQTAEERNAEYKKIADGAHLIITNPEMLEQEAVMQHLAECGISHIAIDEAHCVTEWGESFRPAYLGLGKAIKTLGSPVVTAFTATASPEVLHRIAQILFGDEWSNIEVIQSDADRPNLHYFVVNACNKVQTALMLSRTEKRPMLIFCGTRHRAENMARELCALNGKEDAKFYHAGMTNDERKDIEEWFFDSDDGVLCATCAYGMGVDKKNIRTVIHLDAPANAEAYLQEAGRGGRDGTDMNAILLWSPSDEAKFKSSDVDSRSRIMYNYATSRSCRRQILLDALNAEKAVCSGCDNCGMTLSATPAWDGGEALRLISSNRSRYTLKQVYLELGNRMNRITQKAIGRRTWSHEAVKKVMEELMAAGVVKERTDILWKGRITVTGKWKALLDAPKRPKPPISNDEPKPIMPPIRHNN